MCSLPGLCCLPSREYLFSTPVPRPIFHLLKAVVRLTVIDIPNMLYCFWRGQHASPLPPYRCTAIPRWGFLFLGPALHYLCLWEAVFMGREGETPPSFPGARKGPLRPFRLHLSTSSTKSRLLLAPPIEFGFQMFLLFRDTSVYSQGLLGAFSIGRNV